VRTIGVKGAGVVPIVLWGKPHQFGKFDGGGAGGGGGDQGPFLMTEGPAPPAGILGWFTRIGRTISNVATSAWDTVRGAIGL